ncbi:MAG: hypothetical protein JO235_07470 [Chroococcidiopsidaceae cyanobacterium CP_BM_RX_35]|nr:hypothetical protein [Chroococcidiopsidaceae cyanobacterium CP_BM_RX_35]
MEAILANAQQLVHILLSLIPSIYQRENLEAMLGLFLSAQGYPLHHFVPKPESARKSDYTEHAHWMAALKELSPQNYETLLD